MLHSLSMSIVNWISKSVEMDYNSKIVTTYGIELILDNLIKMLGIIIIGYILGMGQMVVYIILYYYLLF